MTAGDGNGWVRCALGHRHWGRFGAAGLLLRRPGPAGSQVFLQHRSAWTAHGDTWGLVGGARDSTETPAAAALREAAEEAGVPVLAVAVGGEFLDEHGGWSYVTVLADLVGPFVPVANDESRELRWVSVDAVDALPLHPGFRVTWPQLRRLLG